MDCKKAEQYILDMDSTELSESTGFSLLGHIEQCAECKASYDLVRTLRHMNPAGSRHAEPDWDHFLKDVRKRLLTEACHTEKDAISSRPIPPLNGRFPPM